MIPIKGDESANEAAMNKVRADKLREVTAGHDGRLSILICGPLSLNTVFRNVDCTPVD